MTASLFNYLYGAVMLVIAVFLIVKGVRRLTRCTQSAIGTVCEIREGTHYGENHENLPVKSPVIRYKVNGKTYKYKANYTSGRLKHGKGDRIPVLYDPENPKRVRIKGYNSYDSLLFGGIFIIIGSIAILVGKILD